MPKLPAVLSLLIFVTVTGCAQPDNVATIEAVDNAAGKLDEAFVAQDAAAIKGLMTPDHVAVTPYYKSPQTVDQQLASLPDLKYEQTNLSEPKVIVLGDGVAMRTLTAEIDGTFEGEPISGEVFVTSVLVERDGKWLEHFYQVTRLGP